VGELTAPVVYGADDRVEVYNHPNDQLGRIARESIVALIPSFRIDRQVDGTYGLYTESLGELRGLCADEKFGNQPTAAACSGVLIDDDLVLTAGHCIDDHTPCDTYNYVFNYYLSEPNFLEAIRDEDVYSCARVVSQGNPSSGSYTPDFTVIQLDRPVEGPHAPVSIRPARPLEIGESLAMIGFGSGLPAKIDTGGAVFDPRANRLDFFVANLDAFQGHSGSATFDAENRLAGILIGGRTPDYVTLEGETCTRVSVYQDREAKSCTTSRRSLRRFARTAGMRTSSAIRRPATEAPVASRRPHRPPRAVASFRRIARAATLRAARPACPRLASASAFSSLHAASGVQAFDHVERLADVLFCIEL
jgi:hypothetical protein